jgi:hypothetical protein
VIVHRLLITAVLLVAAYPQGRSPKQGWSLDTPLPQKRVNVVARRGADGLIYAFSSGPRIAVFKPSTHRWSVRTPGLATSVPPRANLAELMYMVANQSFTVYDPRTNTWTRLAPLPVERVNAAVVAGKDGKIYVLGGERQDPADATLTDYPRSLDVYDPTTNTWQVKADMPTGREGLGAVVRPDGTIEAIGGGVYQYPRLPITKCLSVVEAYHPGTNTWSRMPSLLQPMCGVTAGWTARGTIDAVGGSTVAGGEQAAKITDATGRIVALAPGAHTWTVLSRAPLPRKHAGAVVEPDGTIYLIGGADRFGHATATVQKCTRCSP